MKSQRSRSPCVCQIVNSIVWKAERAFNWRPVLRFWRKQTSIFHFVGSPRADLKAEIWPAFRFQRNASPQKTTKLPPWVPESGRAHSFELPWHEPQHPLCTPPPCRGPRLSLLSELSFAIHLSNSRRTSTSAAGDGAGGQPRTLRTPTVVVGALCLLLVNPHRCHPAAW
jgi:hypothetical protein